MLTILASINFLLGAFDAWLTRRRMRKFGIWVELNSSIKWLAAMCGIELGVLLGVMGPVAAQTILFYWLRWPVAFALLIGFRAKLFVNQVQSMKFERQLEQFRKDHPEIGRRSPDSDPPTDAS